MIHQDHQGGGGCPDKEMKSDARSVVERLFIILRLIPQSGNRISINRIKELLEDDGIKVDKRTLQRDMVALSGSGLFQITSDECKPRGWFWSPDAVKLELPAMDSNTALTFAFIEEHLARVLPQATLSYLKPYFKQSRVVLGRAASKYSKWPEKILVVPRGLKFCPAKVDDGVQRVVYDALMRDMQIKVKYQKMGARKPAEYILNPLGIVVKDASITLVAVKVGGGEVQNFLLHRMQSAALTGEPVKRPRDFSLARHIKSGEAAFKLSEAQLNLRLKLCTDYVQRLFSETPLDCEQRIVLDPDGSVILEALLFDTEVLRASLLSFGSQIEILEPKELREWMREELGRMGERYR